MQRSAHQASRPGRFLVVTLVLFVLFMIGIALAVWITGGSASLPFEYEGFD